MNLSMGEDYLITYRVFHHNLLITKLHYIDSKKYTDGIYSSKGMLHGYGLPENLIFTMKGGEPSVHHHVMQSNTFNATFYKYAQQDIFTKIKINSKCDHGLLGCLRFIVCSNARSKVTITS